MRRCARIAADRSVVLAIGVAEATDHRSAPRTPGFGSSSRRRSSRGRQTRSPRTAASNRSYSGGSTLASPSSRAPAEEIAEDMRRGRYLDAREALDYGLLDEISTTR